MYANSDTVTKKDACDKELKNKEQVRSSFTSKKTILKYLHVSSLTLVSEYF